MKKTTGATWMGLALVGLAVGGCYRASGDRPGEPSDPPAPDDPFRTPDAGPPPPDTPPWAPPEGGEGAPPLSGGTMAVTSDGRVLAADPATATLFLYDPGEGILGQLALGDGADPGRVAVDEAGRVHVVLRRAGELLDAAVDADGLRELSRRPVCAAPRGLAVDGDALHVACASGELVTLPAAGGAPTRVVEVDGDLRDVVVGDGVLYVSRFRAAELLTLDAAGAVIERRRPEARTSLEMRSREGPVELAPGVAYRIRRLPDGRIGMLHQRMVSTPLEVESSGYSGGDCGAGVAQTAFSIFEAAGGTPTSSGTIPGALLVDFAMDASGGQLFLVSGAVMTGATPFEVSVHAIPVAALSEPCAFFARDHGAPAHSVARLPDGRLVTQHHDTSELFVLRTDTGARIEGVTHPGAPRRDRGFVLFHQSTPSGVACASCHPEGGEDGHVWDFVGTGPRRTQTLLGGVLETAPFHWNGDQPSMDAIMEATFAERMGQSFEAEDVDAIEAYLDRQPLPAPGPVEPELLARGQAVFEGAGACASCHAGEAFTDGSNADVGTGRAFQVPSLRGVSYRAPYLHDGCADTLLEVVDGACGTAESHGGLAGLTSAEKADLVAYLRSL